jgi:hypothetical protein
MPIQYTTNYQFNAPVDAVGVSVTPNGTAWNNSAWVTVFTADADCVLTGIVLFSPGVQAMFQVDVAVDTGGGEVVIATHGGEVAFNATLGWGNLPFRIPIDAIPNGADVKVRMRKANTNTSSWEFALTYYKKPITGNLLTSTSPQLVTTMNPVVTLDSDATPWTNGNWENLLTVSDDDVVITGLMLGWAFNGANYIFELGISSSPIWAVKGQNGLADFPLFLMLKHPLRVANGVTVQGRWRKADTSLTEMGVALHYQVVPEP